MRSGTHIERWVCVVAIRGLAFVEKVPLLRSSKNVWKQLTQGLRPGLCRSLALAGLFYAFTTKQLLGRPFRSVKTVLCFSYITSVSRRKHLSEYIVLVSVSTRKHFSEYLVLISVSARTYIREYDVLIFTSTRK